jgi:hypothetical protein
VLVSHAFAGKATSRGRGPGTQSYASVAAAQPYGIIALRRRGVRYGWVGVGLAVLGLTYVGPIVAAFRLPAVPSQTAALPALSIPAVGFPRLHVPRVHAVAPRPRLAPRPPLTPTKTSAPAPALTSRAIHHPPRKATTATRRIMRHRVPVVSDTHSQGLPPTPAQKAKAEDPFAEAAVVEDSIGAPVELSDSASTAPPAAASDSFAGAPVV